MATSRNHIPRVGPSKALILAPPDTSVEELPELLATVPRFECRDCGNQKFGRSDTCGECGGDEIEKVPGPAGGGSGE
jgi:predicted RNA-binding Zn-ribbon protein involved in translation (DUF1610 family)